MTSPTSNPFWRDWYDLVTSPELRQGDIFRGLLAYWLPQDLSSVVEGLDGSAEQSVRILSTRGDWIVLSASCDIVRGDNTHVLLARVAEVNDANLRADGPKSLQNKVEVLRQGYDPARLLLAEFGDAEPPFPMSFVEYRQQVFLPLQYLKAQCAHPRMRLKSPFREKLGSWAAANLGRVGVEDHAQIPRKAGFSASEVLRTVDDPPYP